jgi:NADH-quinone oxidoreductase subunit C
VILLPSSAETQTEAAADAAVDQARSALLEAIQTELGEALVEHHLEPGVDLTVRIDNAAWSDTATYLRERQRFRFFDFLSAIDWLPSPFGRSMDAAVDATPDGEAGEADEMTSGLAGGVTRFQVLARVFNLTTNIGLTLKSDIGDDMTIGSWVATYPGAEWHERETWEMFGIGFEGHPGLRPLYLPTDFEGNPLRKDFPLLARIIKPWPGIVDVEPMPEIEEAAVPEVAEAEPVAVADAPAAEADTTAVPEPEPKSAPEPEAGPVAEEPTPAEPAAARIGAETDPADIAGIPAALLERSKKAKEDKGDDS